MSQSGLRGLRRRSCGTCEYYYNILKGELELFHLLYAGGFSVSLRSGMLLMLLFAALSKHGMHLHHQHQVIG